MFLITAITRLVREVAYEYRYGHIDEVCRMLADREGMLVTVTPNQGSYFMVPSLWQAFAGYTTHVNLDPVQIQNDAKELGIPKEYLAEITLTHELAHYCLWKEEVYLADNVWANEVFAWAVMKPNVPRYHYLLAREKYLGSYQGIRQ